MHILFPLATHSHPLTSAQSFSVGLLYAPVLKVFRADGRCNFHT